MVFGSYSGVWISSTSTTAETSYVPSYATRALVLVFLLSVSEAPTLGGDMMMKYEL
jgi:hypothetical protein